MFPFLYVGPLRFGTYGIMLATGLFVGYYLLRAELERRHIQANARVLILTIGITGFVASKLYRLVDTPAVWRHPALLLRPQGFTFYGAVMGGIIAALFLARHYGVPVLSLLDSVSTGAALGYGFGRVGCFLAGDGDYGIPTSLPWGMSFPHGIVPTVQRVHPTPIYEFLGAAAICLYLWQLGVRRGLEAMPPGGVFARYLILTGVARFLVEFIRLNPRGRFGLTNAQEVAIISFTSGVALLLFANAALRSRVQAPL